ncbi:hypothetical protein ACFQ6N_37520 [Kitasatospora sp. NPDC056446]|uniref:hypothetical protein n=1 Tax=Kitasatospora sp. NPDC056446 TaxID=3345819 RepID=UPI0036B1B777
MLPEPAMAELSQPGPHHTGNPGLKNGSGAFANCRPTPAGGAHAMSFREEPAVLTLTVRQVETMVLFR